MNPISIPYHLVIPSALCVIGLFTIFVKRKYLFSGRGKTVLWTNVTVFLFLYLFIVGSATYNDIYYQWDLNQYDLDKDGFFVGKEVTKEQQEAMEKLTNDLGRNFSLITGLLFAFPISLLTYGVGRICIKQKQKT